MALSVTNFQIQTQIHFYWTCSQKAKNKKKLLSGRAFQPIEIQKLDLYLQTEKPPHQSRHDSFCSNVMGILSSRSLVLIHLAKGSVKRSFHPYARNVRNARFYAITQRTQRDDTHMVKIFDNSMQVWIFSCYEKGVDALKEIIICVSNRNGNSIYILGHVRP